MKVRIYGKPDCGLCDEAKVAAERARRHVAFDLEVVDISADVELLARYRYEIPVVFVNDRKALAGRVTEDELVKVLQS